MKYVKFVSYTFVVVSILLLSGIVTRPAYATICGGTPCVDSADVINGTLLGVDHSGTIQMPGTNITNNSVQSIDIQDGTITSTDIQDGTVTSTDIQDGTITGTDILNGTIGGLDINSAEIQSRVSGTCAAGNSIRTVNADGSVVCEPDDTGGTATDVVCVGCVGSTDIGADACGATQIATDAVGAAEIAAGAVGAAEIADGTVGAAEIADGSVGAAEIATDAVGSLEIAAGAVGSSEINNAQVQQRVTGTCAAGSSIRTVNADGTVVCETDDIGSGANFIQNQSAAPQAGSFYINGEARTSDMIRVGSETGTTQPPSIPGIVIRTIFSNWTTAGNIMARTDSLKLERDGTNGGWQLTASFSGRVISCTGLTSAGAAVNKRINLAAGTNVIYTDAEAIVYMSCIFGNPFGASYDAQVTLHRWPGDYYWTGFLVSNYNQ